MEEWAYRLLLEQRATTCAELAELLTTTADDAQAVLDALEEKGLATSSSSSRSPPRYFATPPELAVEALVGQRQASLDRARLAIPDLKEHARGAIALREDQLVEVLSSSESLSQALSLLRQTARNEIVGFQRAPLPYAGFMKKRPVRAGVRARSISDATYLALPGAVDSLKLDLARGEHVRTITALPVKLFIADRQMGLVSLHTAATPGPALLLHTSALLESMCVLFDAMWEQATPMIVSATGRSDTPDAATRLSETAEQLLPLLAAGLNDKAIAHQTGMSPTTLNRRLAEMMRASGTRTRFQLGWRAAIDRHPNDPEPSGG
jgi:sugar-specific transcriptional regulator TrmB